LDVAIPQLVSDVNFTATARVQAARMRSSQWRNGILAMTFLTAHRDALKGGRGDRDGSDEEAHSLF
jgi:hypothetical protein